MIRSLLSITTWGSMAMWIAAVVAAGVAAAGVFAVLPGLEPTLPHYPGLDTAAHGRLAAGLITEPIFTATDMAQVVLSLLVVGCIAAHWLKRIGSGRRIARWIWTLACLLAVTCFWSRLVWLMPKLNHSLHQYRDAARSGDSDRAVTAFKAFEALHPTASTLMELTLALMFAALCALAVMYTPRPASEPTR